MTAIYFIYIKQLRKAKLSQTSPNLHFILIICILLTSINVSEVQLTESVAASSDMIVESREDGITLKGRLWHSRNYSGVATVRAGADTDYTDSDYK